MELKFQMEKIPCLRQVKNVLQTVEETQELRLTDSQPDVGRVLCTWGQVVLRSKEWQSDYMAANCTVMVWVLYAPEDGSPAQCVETTLPLTLKWDLSEDDERGKMVCHTTLKAVDARVISGRKLMVRATVGALGQAYVPGEITSYMPEQVPEDVYLKQVPHQIPFVCETGEKAFVMDEELTLPESAPQMEKLIRYSLLPEVSDQKVLGDKAVFRGNALLHLLYKTPEGTIQSWDFEIPYSQYTQLQQEYGHDSQVEILPLLTGLDLAVGEQGRLRLKAGLTGQYLVYDTKTITVVEDAYSTQRTITVQTDTAEIPCVTERQSQRIREEQTVAFGGSRVADVEFRVGCPRTQRQGGAISLELPGSFQVLYYDHEGSLRAENVNWQEEMSLSAEENGNMTVYCSPSGKPTAIPGDENMLLRGEVLMQTVTVDAKTIPMAMGLTLGDPIPKDPHRPSLILRRAGGDDLWSLARKNGSTVEAICQANGLQGQPDPQQMLLIPVL